MNKDQNLIAEAYSSIVEASPMQQQMRNMMTQQMQQRVQQKTSNNTQAVTSPPTQQPPTQGQIKPQIRLCPECGYASGGKFCGKCGANVEQQPLYVLAKPQQTQQNTQPQQPIPQNNQGWQQTGATKMTKKY
jgi:hypothetical protein